MCGRNNFLYAILNSGASLAGSIKYEIYVVPIGSETDHRKIGCRSDDNIHAT
jgi:hypothetical protein